MNWLNSTMCSPPISTLFPYTTLFRSLHVGAFARERDGQRLGLDIARDPGSPGNACGAGGRRCRGSEEHTAELQAHSELVCRLLLEENKKLDHNTIFAHTSETQGERAL